MKIAYINGKGERFNIVFPNYILTGFDGFTSIPIDHKTKKAPYQQGESLIDSMFDPRHIVLEFEVLAEDRQILFDRIRNMIRILNPRLGLGYIEFIQEDTDKVFCIDCVPEEIEIPTGRNARGRTYQSVIASFLAPLPYWYDPNTKENYFVGFSGGLSLPFSFPWTFGTVGTEVTFNYNGDVEAPVFITMKGMVENPQIRNITTGKVIKVNTIIENGSVLTINTGFGEKEVLLDGENAFEYISPESEFWTLIPGENNVAYTCDDENENSECKLAYKEWFTGV